MGGKMNKFTWLGLSLVIIITMLLTSCGTKPTPTTTSVTTQTTAAVTTTTPSNVSTTAATTKPTTTSVSTVPTTQITTTTATQKTTSTPSSTVANYKISITITSGGMKTVSITLADLKKLPQVTSSTQETGPTLLSVLNSLGVQNYSQVTVYGDNQVTPTTLLKAQITDNVMLALTDRGTATLTGADVTNHTIDVNNIIVQ